MTTRAATIFLASGLEDAVRHRRFKSRESSYDEARQLIEGGVTLSPTFYDGWVKGNGDWMLNEIKAALGLSDVTASAIKPGEGAEVTKDDKILWANYDRIESKVEFYLIDFT